MATANITQLPAALNINGVFGNPFVMSMTLTITDDTGNPLPWTDVTNYIVTLTDQYGNSVTGGSPTITSSMDYNLTLSWTATQTTLISNAQATRWALEVTISGQGPLALVAGTFTMTPPTYPAT